ncbi:MAG: ATP-binding cassette domain-containing protein, partial [Clostridiales bacterium]|nr:ATP-binding cassette domain-containing protein [Clostridiales bacterium]
MPAVEVRHLYKTFQAKEGTVEALKDVSLTIEAGDIYGIIGMSGAGKSTLVRCLNYLEKPTSGEVIVDGRDLGSLSEKEMRMQRSDIAMIFQHFNLLMQKSVIDNVCFPMQIQKKNKRASRDRALELLKIVGLEEKANAYPSQLSGGQKQRVAIARALASDPKILLCDEATSALDPQTTSSILELLKEINEKYEITIVIITHQMSVVQEICKNVGIIDGGELVEKGEVLEIFSNPKTKKAKELILSGSENGARKELQTLESTKIVRIVFTRQSSFEPVIANMVLKFATPVNILGASTKNVGGIAAGE